jgi:acetoin utilization protein AcuB
MLVGERMSYPVITISPDLPIVEALNLMKRERIRRTPVVKDGVLVGIVSDKDLLNASPSPASAMSVWELSYILSKIQVIEVMSRKVLTVTETTPIEEAARIMADNKIGGLPVMKDGQIVGIITETDLFKIFLELMGARELGVRVTALISDEKGTLARITQAIYQAGGSFIAFGQFAGVVPGTRLITFKVSQISEEETRTVLLPLIVELIDLRVCCSNG